MSVCNGRVHCLPSGLSGLPAVGLSHALVRSTCPVRLCCLIVLLPAPWRPLSKLILQTSRCFLMNKCAGACWFKRKISLKT